MNYGRMTREEAVQEFGESLVDKVDAEQCGYHSGNMWTASVQIPDDTAYLIAVYFQDADTNGVEDLSDLEWEIDHYSTSPDYAGK